MIIYILSSAVVLFVMWVVFANVDKYTGKQYNPVIQALAHLYGFIFGIVNSLLNVTVGTLVFWQLPSMQRLMLSSRLRYILSNGDAGWRYNLALFVCTKLVEPWDYNHCGLFGEK